jgi:hypothetical protein
MSLRLLALEEKKSLLDSLVEAYGFDGDALGDCEVLEGNEGYWAVSPEVIALPLRKLVTDSIGILLARRRSDDLAPTIAALQFFARPRLDSLRLSQADATRFIDRKAVAVDASNGRHVVFCGDHALDLGWVRDGWLVRVASGKPTRRP